MKIIGLSSGQEFEVTERENEVYEFLKGYKQRNDGCAPSFEDICDGVGIASRSHVHRILTALQKQGLIYYEPGIARSIRVVGGHWEFRG